MKKILVVDDDEGIQSLINMILHESNIQVEKCFDPDLAVSKAKYTDYDFILVDYLFPTTTGIDVINKLKEVTDSPLYLISNFRKHEIKGFGYNIDEESIGFINKENLNHALKALTNV